jgi:hypothetical protein
MRTRAICGEEDMTVARAFLRFCGVVTAFVLAFGAADTDKSYAALLTGGSCGPATQAFAQFGDSRYYNFAPNGGLELGGYGWSLSSGATVVSGNESYYLHSRYDSHSLSLSEGATATTPLMCMGTSSTVIRFVYKGTGRLRVQVVERNLLGLVIGVLDWTTIGGSSSWQPSPTVANLDSLLGLLGASTVQLRFTALDGASAVDDVYVDPMASSG